MRRFLSQKTHTHTNTRTYSHLLIKTVHDTDHTTRVVANKPRSETHSQQILAENEEEKGMTYVVQDNDQQQRQTR